MPSVDSSESVPTPATESWLVRVFSGISRDLRHAVRLLGKEPGFAAITLATLALCIGATTAIFSLVYALLLRPLPFPEPNRIVELYNTYPKIGLNKMPSNVVQYLDYKENTASYDAVGLCGTTTAMIGEVGSAERIEGASATADMFDVLGLKPLIGQFFTAKNSNWGEHQVVVLTQTFWASHFHEDPGVLGRTLRIDGETFHIVGVAPRAIEAFDARLRFIKPIAWSSEKLDPHMRFMVNTPLYARLKANVSAVQAHAEAVAVERHCYDTTSPQAKEFLDRSGYKIAIGLVQAERVQPIKSSLILLQGGVAFVLLIGCVNIANLLLTRANGRLGDLAIRSALGASRGTIARQLLIESLFLTLSGAALGVGLAWGVIRLVNQFSAKLLPNLLPFSIDGRVLGFAIGLSVLVGLLIGLIPVAHILRANLVALIHRNSRSTSGGRGVRALSGILVTGQIAVALVLLTGAGLLIQSFANALAVNPGFDPRNIITGSVALPGDYYAPGRSRAFQQRLLQGLQEIPGVDAATIASGVPYQGGLNINTIAVKESTLAPDAPQPGAFQVGVAVGYFQALHLQLVEGRFFDETDNAPERQAYIVDERFAQRYLAGHSAVGAHFSFTGPPAKESDWPVIVGVVRNVPHNGVEDRSNLPFIYYPMMRTSPGGLSILVRSHRSTGDIVSALREKLRAIDPSIPLFDTSTLQKVVDESFGNRRAVMLLLASFAALALFLSALGIYGVLAYDVSQRTREIGIRGALGATRSQIINLIIRQGLWKTGIGLAVGLISAIFLSRYMVGLLFDLKPTDPWVYGTVSILLGAVASLASYLPARTATTIEPIEALKIE